MDHSELDAEAIVRYGLQTAGDICVFTNHSHTLERLDY